MLNILGVDASATATGLCGPTDWRMNTFKPKVVGPARLYAIREYVHAFAKQADVIVIEGYSFSSKGTGIYQVAEVGGVLRLMLWELCVPYVEVPPASLKRFATGRGNAPKEALLVQCVRRLNLDPVDSDQSDAAWLRAMGLAAYNALDVALPQAQRSALDGLPWPVLGERTT